MVILHNPRLPLPLPVPPSLPFRIHRQDPLIEFVKTHIKVDVIRALPLLPARKDSILTLPLLLPLILTRPLIPCLLILLRRLLIQLIP